MQRRGGWSIFNRTGAKTPDQETINWFACFSYNFI
jgi:hypothetical protein